jgi:hypothetical protein
LRKLQQKHEGGLKEQFSRGLLLKLGKGLLMKLEKGLQLKHGQEKISKGEQQQNLILSHSLACLLDQAVYRDHTTTQQR